MLRSELNDALKSAMKTKDTCAVGTIRLILASVKDQDICARTDGDSDGISDEQVLALLNTMVKQRRESIRLYEQGGRLELAQREQAEIDDPAFYAESIRGRIISGGYTRCDIRLKQKR